MAVDLIALELRRQFSVPIYVENRGAEFEPMEEVAKKEGNSYVVEQLEKYFLLKDVQLEDLSYSEIRDHVRRKDFNPIPHRVEKTIDTVLGYISNRFEDYKVIDVKPSGLDMEFLLKRADKTLTINFKYQKNLQTIDIGVGTETILPIGRIIPEKVPSDGEQ